MRKIDKRKEYFDRRTRNQEIAKFRMQPQNDKIYIFRNHKECSLILPKESLDGKKEVFPGETWKGDSYFLDNTVNKLHLAVVVEECVSSIKKAEEQIMEEKLILDQPATVTTKGIVEQVVVNDMVQLNEANPDEEKSTGEKLICESPISGIELF